MRGQIMGSSENGHPMKLLFALFVAFAALPAQAHVKVTVTYSSSADLYSMMDNVSGWLDGYTRDDYRQAWIRRFGWSDQDARWVARYKEYRLRTFIDDTVEIDPRTSPDGIFVQRTEIQAASDPFRVFFLKQPDIATALANLPQIASSQDEKMLRGFYKYFEPKWRVMFANSERLQDKSRKLQQSLDSLAVRSFIQRVAEFYNSPIDGEFAVLFTHSPIAKRATAEPSIDGRIVLQSPDDDTDADGFWDTIVMHEFVHHISSGQPTEQKQALTKRFLDRCALPAGVGPLWVLEEPLAVAWGQAAYSVRVLGHPLDPKTNWYNRAWIDVVARAISPTIIELSQNNKTIDNVIVDQAADRCNDLKAIASTLNDGVAR